MIMIEILNASMNFHACLSGLGDFPFLRSVSSLGSVKLQRAVLHLPTECALLTQLSSGIEEMAITASIEGGPTMVYRAIAHDPLTSAVLSLA